MKNRQDRVDDQLAGTLRVAAATYRDEVRTSERLLRALASRPDVQSAVEAGDAGARRELARLLRPPPGDALVVTANAGGRSLVGRKPGDVAETIVVRIKGIGDLRGYLSAPVLARAVSTTAAGGQRVYITVGPRAYAAAGPIGTLRSVPLGRPFRVRISGERVRAAAAPVYETRGVLATYPQARLDASLRSVRTRTALVIAAAILIIGLLAWLLVRSLTATLRVFAARANAVAEGRFDQRLPARGSDEFAQFGRAFNDMSQQLERRIVELEAERRRVQEATGRFGTALAASHDVTALLEIVLGSAMQLARARGGRLLVADEEASRLVEQLRMGRTQGAAGIFDRPVELGEGVEGEALQTLVPTVLDAPVVALCVPLVTERTVIGLLTLVEPEMGAFDKDAPAAVGALAAQGAVAIENARLHRLIQKQARTDGLTGLANRREFQEQLGREVERAQRFGVPVGLIFLDVDDFKAINDGFGHLAGDAVLKAVATVLRGSVREIDHAARYGGEEFALILPHTGLEGAVRLAERIRELTAERPVRVGTAAIRVTASFGAAAVPANASTQIEVIAAADSALYLAKQGGKNRVATALANPDPTAA